MPGVSMGKWMEKKARDSKGAFTSLRVDSQDFGACQERIRVLWLSTNSRHPGHDMVAAVISHCTKVVSIGHVLKMPSGSQIVNSGASGGLREQGQPSFTVTGNPPAWKYKNGKQLRPLTIKRLALIQGLCDYVFPKYAERQGGKEKKLIGNMVTAGVATAVGRAYLFGLGTGPPQDFLRHCSIRLPRIPTERKSHICDAAWCTNVSHGCIRSRPKERGFDLCEFHLGMRNIHYLETDKILTSCLVCGGIEDYPQLTCKSLPRRGAVKTISAAMVKWREESRVAMQTCDVCGATICRGCMFSNFVNAADLMCKNSGWVCHRRFCKAPQS